MRITLICAAAAVVVALGAFSSPESASAAPTCFNKGLELVPRNAPLVKQTVLSACRRESRLNAANVWQEYGMLRIGPQATVADRCRMKIRSVWFSGRKVFSKPSWQSCNDALRQRGQTIAFFASNTAFKFLPDTATQACYELTKNGRRLQGTCVLSQVVDTLPQPT